MYLFLLLYPFKGTESQYSFLQRLPRCNKGIDGLYQTTEAALAVSIRLQKGLGHSLSDRWSSFGGLYLTAEADMKIFE
jgi:hypothetical protein